MDAEGVVEAQPTTPGHLVRVVDRVVAVLGDQVTDLAGNEVGCFENNLSGPDVAIGTAEEWVVAIDGTNVHVADLTDGDCVVVRLGDDAGALGRPVVANRRVFVPETETGAVYIIDPARREAVRHATLIPGQLRLRARADMVVAFDIRSPFAALLDRDGVIRLVDTSIGELASTIFGDDGDNAVVGGGDDAPAVAVEGVDAAVASSDAPVLDANVLAATVQDQPDDLPDPLPDDDLVANFSFSASTVVVGELVRFVDSSTGNPDAWRWDFGDGTGAEGPEVQKAWAEPGTYPVTLTVSRNGEEALISLAITVVPEEVPLPPNADFAFSATVVEVGGTIEFEDRSDGEIERWRWDFGDGTTASTPNVGHSWAEAGRYTVQLTVANEQGSDRASVVIEVLERLRPPEAVLTASSTAVDLGEPVTFIGASTTDPATFDWDFGDGRTSSGAETVHVFLETGTFTVTLTAENAAGTSTAQTTITVSPPTLRPVAVIGTLPTIIEVGDVVSLSSLSTNSPDTEEWSFGDGTTATGPMVTHTWTAEGTYLLTLTATNSAGSDSVTETVEVVAELPPPIADIADYDESPWVNETTVFIDASVDATSWLWDFGDGTTSNSINPLHTFTTPGQKIVTLTVTNRNGSDSTSVIVEPRLEPVAFFEATPRAIRAGQTVSFLDLSDNAASWSWNFGDGTSSTLQNPIHTYNAAGTYGVTLSIDNGSGDLSSHGPVLISVDPAEPALESIDLDAGPDGVITTLEFVQFTAVAAASSGPIDGYEIDYGDGSGVFGASGPTFSHDFAAAGSYTVRMRAHGPLDEWSPWVTRPVTVVDPPPPEVAIDDFTSPQAIGTIPFSFTQVGGGPLDSVRWEITLGGSLVGAYSDRAITHTFADVGTHTVTLIARSPVPAVPDQIVSRDIEIVPPPPPSIDSLTATPDPATTGVLVQFPTVVTGAVTTWEWNYEGSWETGGPTGQHIFNTTGAKTVRLRITDAFGQEVEAQVGVQVNPGPDITPIVASPASPVPTGTVVMLSSSDPLGLPGLSWGVAGLPDRFGSSRHAHLQRQPLDQPQLRHRRELDRLGHRDRSERRLRPGDRVRDGGGPAGRRLHPRPDGSARDRLHRHLDGADGRHLVVGLRRWRGQHDRPQPGGDLRGPRRLSGDADRVVGSGVRLRQHPRQCDVTSLRHPSRRPPSR